VRKHPYSVVVLDEIEKAHPELFNVLLQVMDHATLTDNNGRKADFRNVVLIMTTNAGAHEISKGSLGFDSGRSDHGKRDVDVTKAKSAIERTFSPEFRNRLDAWILFAGLSQETILKVVDKELGLLRAQLSERNVTLNVDDSARRWLAEHGYEPAYGARPMARLIEDRIKKPLAEALLFGDLSQGGVTNVTREGDELRLTHSKSEARGS
jgi:ATP-dependent Clp protease ATP-binding subunit ClpA